MSNEFMARNGFRSNATVSIDGSGDPSFNSGQAGAAPQGSVYKDALTGNAYIKRGPVIGGQTNWRRFLTDQDIDMLTSTPVERYYAERMMGINVTLDVYEEHLALNADVSAGLYRIEWSYSFSANSVTRDIDVLLSEPTATYGFPEPTTINRIIKEQKDSAGVGAVAGTGTDQEDSSSGFREITLPAGPKSFSLSVRITTPGIQVSIW